VTERDLYAVDPQAASQLYLDGYRAGERHERDTSPAWSRGFLTCLLIALFMLCWHALRG
jgi:hypothetical protein